MNDLELMGGEDSMAAPELAKEKRGGKEGNLNECFRDFINSPPLMRLNELCLNICGVRCERERERCAERRGVRKGAGF